MLSKYLPYPFGPVPDVEACVSLRYNQHWKREIVIIWQQQDGLGLSWEDFEKTPLFEKYRKAKKTVEGMQGIFDYQTLPGKGHVLTIRYPELDLYDIGQKARFSGPLKILIIDPDQNFINQVFDTYTLRGCIVHDATSTHTGLEIFQKEKPHLVIIDEHMPGSSINGVEAIGKIRQNDPQACCIMTTKSEEDQNSQAQARGLGVIAYYVKPFNIERINFSISETKGFFKLRDTVKQWSAM